MFFKIKSKSSINIPTASNAFWISLIPWKYPSILLPRDIFSKKTPIQLSFNKKVTPFFTFLVLLKLHAPQPLLFLVVVSTLLFIILSFFFFMFSLSNFTHFFCFSYSSGGSQMQCTFRLPIVWQETFKFNYGKKKLHFPTSFPWPYFPVTVPSAATPLTVPVLSLQAVISAGGSVCSSYRSFSNLITVKFSLCQYLLLLPPQLLPYWSAFIHFFFPFFSTGISNLQSFH